MAELTDDQRVDFLCRTREARALVLRDSEAFDEAARVLEYIGQVIQTSNEKRPGGGLGHYKNEIVVLASGAHSSALFEVVRRSRNDAVHDGARARNGAACLVELLLLLEESILSKAVCAGHIMVRDPVVAETWHPIRHVRRLMLAHSFSCIPAPSRDEGKWLLLKDVDLVRLLKKDRNIASMSVESVISDDKVCFAEARCFDVGKPIVEVEKVMDGDPILVTELVNKVPRLRGIITPFDILSFYG